VAPAPGEVVLLPDLNAVQGVAFDKPTVVLAKVGWVAACWGLDGCVASVWLCSFCVAV
jgi:hypothetical protein